MPFLPPNQQHQNTEVTAVKYVTYPFAIQIHTVALNYFFTYAASNSGHVAWLQAVEKLKI